MMVIVFFCFFFVTRSVGSVLRHSDFERSTAFFLEPSEIETRIF